MGERCGPAYGRAEWCAEKVQFENGASAFPVTGEGRRAAAGKVHSIAAGKGHRYGAGGYGRPCEASGDSLAAQRREEEARYDRDTGAHGVHGSYGYRFGGLVQRAVGGVVRVARTCRRAGVRCRLWDRCRARAGRPVGGAESRGEAGQVRRLGSAGGCVRGRARLRRAMVPVVRALLGAGPRSVARRVRFCRAAHHSANEPSAWRQTGLRQAWPFLSAARTAGSSTVMPRPGRSVRAREPPWKRKGSGSVT